MHTGAFLLTTVLLVSGTGIAMAEIHKHGGSLDAVPHAKYVRVVSEADSPVQQTYILVGTADGLLSLATTLHDLLAQASKSVRMDVYEHGYHDFVLGPQGQKRQDLPQGEVLLQGALDALELSVSFVKAPTAASK